VLYVDIAFFGTRQRAINFLFLLAGMCFPTFSPETPGTTVTQRYIPEDRNP